MVSQEEELLIEVAATNMAITQAIGGLAALATDQRPFMTRILETGLGALENADYQDISRDLRAAFVVKLKARYTQLITGIEGV